MNNVIDRTVTAALRSLPDWRGKASLARRWKALRERSKPLDGGCQLRLADGSTISAPRGSGMTWSVAAVGHWDRHLVERVAGYIAPGTLALDVGASLGLWTVPLGRIARANGSLLWCFEPNPDNHRWLDTNIERNGLGGIAEVKRMALGEQAGSAYLALREHGGGNGALDVGGGPGAVAVPVARLDDLDLPRRVSFVKLDVEGFELEVLRGARETLARDQPVIFGEFSTDWLQIRGEDLSRGLASLAELGYEVFAVVEQRSAAWHPMDKTKLRRLQPPFPSDEQNLLLMPRPGARS
jgi:FkbM family methyltransferase